MLLLPPIRCALITVYIVWFAVFVYSQTPKGKGTTEQKSALDHAPTNGTQQNEQHATSSPSPVVTIYNQPCPQEQNSDTKRSQDAINIERRLTTFTGYLVVVGFLQFLVLCAQAVLFFQQKRIMGQHKASLEQLATAAGNNALAAKASADALVNSERSWVIPEVEFRHRETGRVMETYNGKTTSTMASIQVTCSNRGNTPAWITEIDVRMEIGLIPRFIPEFTPEAHEISLQYEPIAPDGPAFVHFRQITAEGKVTAKEQAFIYGIVKYRDAFTPNGKSYFGYSIQQDGLKYILGRIRDAQYNDCK